MFSTQAAVQTKILRLDEYTTDLTNGDIFINTILEKDKWNLKRSTLKENSNL